MAIPPRGRAGQSGFSPRLGARDPRLRSNAQGALSDSDLDKRTLARNARGETRIAAVDALSPLREGASSDETAKAYNLLLRRLQGSK